MERHQTHKRKLILQFLLIRTERTLQRRLGMSCCLERVAAIAVGLPNSNRCRRQGSELRFSTSQQRRETAPPLYNARPRTCYRPLRAHRMDTCRRVLAAASGVPAGGSAAPTSGSSGLAAQVFIARTPLVGLEGVAGVVGESDVSGTALPPCRCFCPLTWVRHDRRHLILKGAVLSFPRCRRSLPGRLGPLGPCCGLR